MNWSAFARSPSNSVGALPMRRASWFAGGIGGAAGGLGAPGFPLGLPPPPPGLPPPPPGLLPPPPGFPPPPPGLLLGCRFIAVSSFFCTEAVILGLVVVVAVVVVAVVVAMVCSCINKANGRVSMSGEFLMMVLVWSSVGSSSVVGELGCWSVETGDGGRVLSSASSSESRGMGRNVPPSRLRRRFSCAFSSLWASMSGLLGPHTSLNLSPSSSR
jgi:hypothetical protein